MTVPRALLYDAQRRGWLAFAAPRAVYAAWQPGEVVPALAAALAQAQAQGMYLAGFVAYEAAPAFDAALPAKDPAGFPLLWFGLFDEPAGWPALPADPPWTGELAWQPSVSETTYRRHIQQIKRHIAAGDTYQVNYTLRLRAPFPADPWAFFLHLARAQQADYAGFIDTGDWAICCASPEMFFEQQGRTLSSRPMKGTARRGLWAEDDLARAAALRASEKDQAENVMIVDMVRNDLGRLADLGSVHVPRLFAVEQYPTVWQMTSTVQCTTDAGLVDIFRALFPPASITGAPKRRTMQIIDRLENAPRRIYTGSLGFVTPAGLAQFNVAIRTVLVDRRRAVAEYGVGGGIVWDSTAAAEYREWRTKALVLTHRPPVFDLLETLRWTPAEGFWLLEGHLARLAASARYFGRPLDVAALRQGLLDAAAGWPAAPQRVRLTVDPAGELRIEARPLAPLPSPYRVALAARPVDAGDRFLYHKTTHRAVYEQARAEQPGYDDVLLWNARGELTESCIATLIVELDGQRYTPPVRCGLLPGVYRAHLLAQGQVRERILRLADLARCRRVWLGNAVRGEWEVSLADYQQAT